MKHSLAINLPPAPRLSVVGSHEAPELLGQFIPLHYHFPMLRDQVRLRGFKEAIEKTVPVGGKVLEFGSGTGVLTFFSAQRAAKVYSVEMIPELVALSRRFLADNGVGSRVEVIQADARSYLPPEPVDAVVCEMLHVGLLREKQMEVIRNFKAGYLAKFGGPLPAFIPDVSILAVQPVEQEYTYLGYHAPVPAFFEPGKEQTETVGLSDPTIYSIIEYSKDLPQRLEWAGELTIRETGTLNALRFVTKNLLAVVVQENRSIDWHNQYLVLPLKTPIPVLAGQKIRISFGYEPGASLASLNEVLNVTVV